MPEKYNFSSENKSVTEKSERAIEIKNRLIRSLDAIRKTGLFEDDFLDQSVLLVFGKKEDFKFEKKAISAVPKGGFNEQDFMQGRRTDFAGINPEDEFDDFMERALKEKHVLELIFLNDKLSYDEFVAHELAHNLFDRLYIQKNGPYNAVEGITDVSDDYRKKIKETIIPLVKRHHPQIEVEKFSFKRQQIAEIFAMLYEREFCRRSNTNIEVHNTMEKNVAEFSISPQKKLAEFNQKFNCEHSLEELYIENHSLSLIVSPLLEKEYPEWKKRTDIFWK